MHPSGNPILDQIVAERQRVNWWGRRPTYLDTKDLNLASVPVSSKAEVTHFRDLNGVDLFAVSNPKLTTGLSFTFAGTVIAIPAKAISVLESGQGSAPQAPAPTSLRILGN